MATSQQKMFNPPSPPYQGGIVLSLTRGIEGVAFHVLAQEKNPLKHCMNNCLFSPGLHLRMLNFLLMLYAG